MTVQAWFIIEASQVAEIVALSGDGVGVEPRLIDNSLANNLGEGTLVGKYVAPARILNDPEYDRWDTILGPLPIRAMDSDVLFVPGEVV